MATVDFCLMQFSVTKIVTRKCQVDDSIESRYYMILGRDLLIALGLDLNFSKHTIIGGGGPYKGCSSLMADITDYYFKPLTKQST